LYENANTEHAMWVAWQDEANHQAVQKNSKLQPKLVTKTK
jgi:hypothetical protein